jgi:hypothetical protein
VLRPLDKVAADANNDDDEADPEYNVLDEEETAGTFISFTITWPSRSRSCKCFITMMVRLTNIFIC